jgi:mono/diheme cytochrome c family protein
MRPRNLLAISCFILPLVGCSQPATQQSATSTATSAPTPTLAMVSKYDSGPRAGETPIVEAQVKVGESLFQEKGCSACHTFGKKLSGPDLAGVTKRRTAQWMENQILHPEVMTKEDPISHQLMTVHALQMPNQGLTPDQVKSVIEYLKHRDHEASEGEPLSDAQPKGN